MIRRLRRQVPAARIIVGLWSLSEHDTTEAGDAVRNIGADLVVNSLPQAVELLSVGTLDKIGAHRNPKVLSRVAVTSPPI